MKTLLEHASENINEPTKLGEEKKIGDKYKFGCRWWAKGGRKEEKIDIDAV